MSAERGRRRRVCVVTGSRAEFGLLLPVIRAIEAHDRLELCVAAGGSHLVGEVQTIVEVRSLCGVDAEVVMQVDGDRRTRVQDAVDVGRGVGGFASAFAELQPDWVVVLGDRIEAFAAGAAASVGGFALAHIHGGDRAEGVADEAMRHAISKLAHLHLAATEASAERLRKMGEQDRRVFVVGSPAIDGLRQIEPMADGSMIERFGTNNIGCVVLLHPSGFADVCAEQALCAAVIDSCATLYGERVLALSPNHDAGREVIVDALDSAAAKYGWKRADHLPRHEFVGLLRRLAIGDGSSGTSNDINARGVLVGNSSAGLIESSAIGVGVVNVGPRQNGRERPMSDVFADVVFGEQSLAAGAGSSGINTPQKLSKETATSSAIVDAIVRVTCNRRASDSAGYKGGSLPGSAIYGDGRSGERIAQILSGCPPERGIHPHAPPDPHDPRTLRKQNTY